MITKDERAILQMLIYNAKVAFANWAENDYEDAELQKTCNLTQCNLNSYLDSLTDKGKIT